MPSSDSDGQQPPPRKRSRTSAEGDAGKKARGRPRVDTLDETAADRRRTQIRLAQRAYRQRKETTIASLQEKNSRLQTIINEMNRSFLQFNHAAISSGFLHINSNLGQQLKQVTENFAALTKSAAAEGSHDGDEHQAEGSVNSAGETHASSEHQPEDHVYQEQTQPQIQMTDIGWGYSAALPEATHQNNPKTSGRDAQERRDNFLPIPTMPNAPFPRDRTIAMKMRPPVHMGHVMDQGVSWSDAPDYESQNPYAIEDFLSRQQYAPPGSDPQIYALNIAPTPPTITRLPTPPYVPSLPRGLSKPWTFSENETTFARRLSRASIESGFQILGSGTRPAATLKYMFRLSIHKDLDELRERFREILARGTDEDLDKWDSPFAHIGGAGTHYPPKNGQGSAVNRSTHWRVRHMGNIVRAENLLDSSKSYDTDFTGFSGEWFDAFDVEGYLEQEKGCTIDPSFSCAQIFIDDDNDDSLSREAGNCNNGANYKLNFSSSRRRSDSYSQPPSFTRGSSTSASSASTSPTDESSRLYTQADDANFGLDVGNIHNTINTGAAMEYTSTDYRKFPHLFNDALAADLSECSFDMPPPATQLPQHMGAINVDMEDRHLNLENIGMDVGSLPIVRQKKKKAVWINVNLLVNELVKSGVCLGRAPGYRRKDVDRAIKLSIVPMVPAICQGFDQTAQYEGSRD